MVHGRSLNWTLLTDLEAEEPRQYTQTGLVDTMQELRNATEWQKLDNRDCIKAYGQDFVSAHGDLLLVLPTTDATGILFPVTEIQSDISGYYDWMCGDQPGCSTDAILREAALSSYFEPVILSNGSNLQFNHSIQYCLSQPVEQQCQVQISLIILGVVVACNATKALCMLFTFRCQKSQPLVTLGDAIESFVKDPDQNTGGMCLASKEIFDNAGKNKINHIWLDSLQKPAWTARPMVWTARRHRWFSSASLKRWLMCNIL